MESKEILCANYYHTDRYRTLLTSASWVPNPGFILQKYVILRFLIYMRMFSGYATVYYSIMHPLYRPQFWRLFSYLSGCWIDSDNIQNCTRQANNIHLHAEKLPIQCSQGLGNICPRATGGKYWRRQPTKLLTRISRIRSRFLHVYVRPFFRSLENYSNKRSSRLK